MLYFAYGSNMSTSRLQNRLPDAKPVGIGVLRNFEFVCNKLSKLDGSGKANIQPVDGAETWGVLFEQIKADLRSLDRIEGGYTRLPVQIEQEDQLVEAVTYISEKTADVSPTMDYFSHVIEGAVEHDLPEIYIEKLRKIETA